MAGLLLLERLKQVSSNYVLLHKHLDPLSAPIEKFAENLRSIEEHFARTSLATNPQARNEKHGVTYLETVTVIFHNYHVLTLSGALKTQFQTQRQIQVQLAEENSSQSSPAPGHLRRAEDSTFLLDRSRLEALGLDTSFLLATGDNCAFYNCAF